jgi:hypothetical protein
MVSQCSLLQSIAQSASSAQSSLGVGTCNFFNRNPVLNRGLTVNHMDITMNLLQEEEMHNYFLARINRQQKLSEIT